MRTDVCDFLVAASAAQSEPAYALSRTASSGPSGLGDRTAQIAAPFRFRASRFNASASIAQGPRARTTR
eukprot:845449-Lingulodinium_polyedra.AAC.1